MYATETKLVQFKLGCYRFRMLTVIPKVTTKKITKTHTEKERRRESKWYSTKNKKYIQMSTCHELNCVLPKFIC